MDNASSGKGKPTANERKLPLWLMRNTAAVLSWIAGIIPPVYAAALQPLGIDGRYLAVLLTLENVGAQVQAHLSELTRIDRATMVSLLNDMEKRGFIERRPHPDDRRANQVHITERGRELIAEADAATAGATERLLMALTPAEREQLHDMLVRVSESITPPDYIVGQPFRGDE